MNCKDITFSSGNRKILNCNIFNLPVGLTCKPGVSCIKYCYSLKAERTYPAVRPSRLRNYKESKKANFVSEVTSILSKKKHKVTRIHEGGDFYSVEYIMKWFHIAEDLPDHKFYAYTKRDDLFTKKIIDKKPKNFTLIFSMDGIVSDKALVGNIAPLFDKLSIVRETKHDCPSTAKDGWKTACIKDCQKCLDSTTKVINFAKH